MNLSNMEVFWVFCLFVFKFDILIEHLSGSAKM